MKVSLKLLEYISGNDQLKDVLNRPDLVQVIGAKLGAVETTSDLSAVYSLATIVKVIAVQSVAASDHLHLCLIEDNQAQLANPLVRRTNQGLVEVVCGANNVKEGMLAVWLPPGSIIPETSDLASPITLSAKQILNMTSYGMLASSRELAISQEHNGILDLSNYQDKIKVGQPFSQVFDYDDQIIEIENKMFTHRPDLFSHLGVAREIAGIYNKPFMSPSWYLEQPSLKVTKPRYSVAIDNQLLEHDCPRFSCIVIDNVKIEPSPLKFQTYLSRLGIRPINNIVDITNFVMQMTAQPLHAYDLGSLKADPAKPNEFNITVRRALGQEQITLINQKTIKLTTNDIVIANDRQALGLAGVMGGLNSEVKSSTTTILLESAVFDMYKIRKTSMQYGIFSDAVTRFSKGQSPRQTVTALAYALDLIKQYIPSSIVSSDLADILNKELESLSQQEIYLDFKTLNAYLGQSIPNEQLVQTLSNVEISSSIQGEGLKVTPPFWRMDLLNKHDIIEEVARLYGIDKLPKSLLVKKVVIPKSNNLFILQNQIRRTLARLGANEIYNYSFVSLSTIQLLTSNTDLAYNISNPISPLLKYFRLDLLTSLITKVHLNHKAGIDQFCLFEIGKTHQTDLELVNNVPAEAYRLGLVLSQNDRLTTKVHDGDAYYGIKYYFEQLVNSLGLNLDLLSYDKLSKLDQNSLISLGVNILDKVIAAKISYNNEPIGIIGQFNNKITTTYKLPKFCSGVEIDLNKLEQILLRHKASLLPSVYLSDYPKVVQDLTIIKPAKLDYNLVIKFLNSAVKLAKLPIDLKLEYWLKDNFFKADNKDCNLTYRFIFTSDKKTYNDKEISLLIDKIASTYLRLSQE